ncbi:MAG: Gfo/Idh/MocA family oxidoreductase [Paracoccaceae bacterium]|nr:Gfo/Idh/MocA family oxidoreductase [Paracoccaceae bacterium]
MPRTCRIAIAGYGLVGRRHAAAMAEGAAVALAGVIEPDAAARAEAAELGVRCFEDLTGFLGTGAADGLILATPNTRHADGALAAIDRGLPVLIEKPIATDTAEARAIVAAADAAGVPVLVGHHRRHNPLIAAAKEAIDAGEIGAIRAVQATSWFYKPDSYFDAADWRKRPGAGPLAVNLIHDIDLLRHLCGEIASVQAVARRSRRGYDNEDIAGALLEFDSGAVGTITVSDSIVAPWSWELTAGEYPVYPVTGQSFCQIGGSHGALSLPDLRLWSYGSGDRDWWAPITPKTLAYTPADPLVAQIGHFAEVIAGRSPPLVPAGEGLMSLAAIEAIARSARTGASVTL